MRFFPRALSVLVLLAPSVAFAAAPRSFRELVDFLVFLMDNVVIILVLCAIVLYFWGITQNINKFGESGGAGADKMRAYFFWGIIILFVMVSVWGILRILENSLFGGSSGSSVVNGSSSGAPCSGFSGCGE